MAWYEPGRNTDHPGDPPPKWAPMGRGRGLLLIAVIVGIVIALVIATTRTAGTPDGAPAAEPASLPSPAPTAGMETQRIEVAEAGVALAFPADWVVQVPMSGPGTVSQELAEPDVEAWILVVAEPKENTDEHCGLARLVSSEFVLTEFADRYRRWLESAPRWQGTVDSMPWTLPAGESVRVEMLDDVGTTEGNVYVGGVAYAVDYLLAPGDSVFIFWCRFQELPAEDRDAIASRWRSIAETIEFLPEE